MVFSWGQEHLVSYSFIIATERLANNLPTAAAAKVTSWVCCVNHGEAINSFSFATHYDQFSKLSWTFPGIGTQNTFLKHLHLFPS